MFFFSRKLACPELLHFWETSCCPRGERGFCVYYKYLLCTLVCVSLYSQRLQLAYKCRERCLIDYGHAIDDLRAFIFLYNNLRKNTLYTRPLYRSYPTGEFKDIGHGKFARVFSAGQQLRRSLTLGGTIYARPMYGSLFHAERVATLPLSRCIRDYSSYRPRIAVPLLGLRVVQLMSAWSLWNLSVIGSLRSRIRYSEKIDLFLIFFSTMYYIEYFFLSCKYIESVAQRRSSISTREATPMLHKQSNKYSESYIISDITSPSFVGFRVRAIVELQRLPENLSRSLIVSLCTWHCALS